MQLKQLAYFVAVVEHGSFSKTASALFLAQSSLSQSIQALEQELGFPLLKRSRNGVLPTEMGKQVYDGIKGLLASMEQMTAQWQRTYQERISLKGPVRIATVPGTYPILMKQVLQNVKESFPNIQYKVHEVRGPLLLPYLAQGQIDLIVSDFLEDERSEAEAFAQEQNLELIEIRKDAYKIAVGINRPLAQAEQFRAVDVANLPLACYFGGDAAADRYFERYFDKNISVEYTSIKNMVREAEEGPGVSVLPEVTIRNSYPDTLRFLTVEGFSVPFVHFVGLRNGALSKKEIEVTVQAIKRTFSEELK